MHESVFLHLQPAFSCSRTLPHRHVAFILSMSLSARQPASSQPANSRTVLSPAQPHTARSSRRPSRAVEEEKHPHEHGHSAPAEPDYSSPGASVEEVRPERWSIDFVRALTPRSRHAMAQEGVLAEELVYYPLEDFDGTAVVQATNGVVAAVGVAQLMNQQQQPNGAYDAATGGGQPAFLTDAHASASEAAAMAAVQYLRWKDYEASRAVALLRVRTTRRRNISGLRHSLFGIAAHRTGPGGGAVPAHEPHELSVAHADLAASSSSARFPSLAQQSPHRSGHSRRRSSSSMSSSSAARIPESPYFASHPLHDRYKSSSGQASSASLIAQQQLQHAHSLPTHVLRRLELEAGDSSASCAQASSASGHAHGHPLHVCNRMRARILREEERKEWEAAEAKRERKMQRTKEQRENEWYAERKAALQAAQAAAAAATVAAAAANAAASGNGSQSARTHRGEAAAAAKKAAKASASASSFLSSLSLSSGAHSSHGSGPRTRAEMLRTGGAASLLAEKATTTPAVHTATSDNISSHSRPPAISRRTSTLPLSQGGTNSHTHSAAVLPSTNHTSSVSLQGGAAHIPSLSAPSVPLSASFGARLENSLSEASARYEAFFASASAKIAARQENEIRALAHAEALRNNLQKKQEEQAKKKAERARLDRVRREAEAAAAQQAREAKFARVEAEEIARVARFEGAYAERVARTEQHVAAAEAERAARVAERQAEEERAEIARRERLEDGFRQKQARLERMAAQAEQDFEASRARLAAQQERKRAAKKEAHEHAREEAALAAAQLAHELCEQKLREHRARVEAHAARNHAAVVAARHSQGARMRVEQRAEREAHRAWVLAQGKAEEDERAARLLESQERKDLRVAAAAEAKAQHLLLEVERKRLEEARARRNLEREGRKEAFAAAQRAEKLQQEQARLAAIAAMKVSYAAARENFHKQSLSDVQTFRAEYAKLRTAGALAKIARDAAQKQKEIDLAREAEAEAMAMGGNRG
jgi:hypothetical protein